MLVQVGKRVSSEDVVDLLLECHSRIRRFLVMARELADARATTSPAEIAAAAGRIRRYFAEGFRLHVEDEEVDIAPRIAKDLAHRLHADHTSHESGVADLVDACASLERRPERFATLAGTLRSLVATLAPELEAHLEFEEQLVFPMLRRLPEPQRAEIRDAMRVRRGRELGLA